MDQKEFAELYESEKPMYEAWAKYVRSYVVDSLRSVLGSSEKFNEFIKVEPSYRIKTTDSLLTKAFIRKKDKYKNPYNEIEDKAGVRFICLLTSQILIIQKIIMECDSWTYTLDKQIDWWKEDDPRAFDYQSVHFVIKASKDLVLEDGSTVQYGTPCEIQVRTLLQHAYAEMAHDTIYKGEVEYSTDIQRSFARSMALLETTDSLLCEVKESVDELTASRESWKREVDKAATILVEDSLDDRGSTDKILNDLQGIVKKADIDEFRKFYLDDNNKFLAKKIKENSTRVEFRCKFIVLIYFFVKRYSALIYRQWPLAEEVLERIYADMGVAFPNSH